MAKNKERKEPTIKPNPKVTTTTPEEGRAPTAPESGMNKKGETTPTRIIKPDPDQGTTTPTPTSKKKQEKKTNPKASVAAEEMSTPSPKSSKAKTSNVPMPTSWAEAGVADRMLVTMRDNGDDWAKIRKQWKELTGLDTAASTLPTRYSRLKAGMTVLEDGDVSCHPAPTSVVWREEFHLINFVVPEHLPQKAPPLFRQRCMERKEEGRFTRVLTEKS